MSMRNDNVTENNIEKEHERLSYIDDGYVTIPVSDTKSDEEDPMYTHTDAENGREAFILALKNQSDKPVQEEAKISKNHTELILKHLKAICLSDIMNSVTARANNLGDHFEISTNLASAVGRYLNMPKEKMVQMLKLCDIAIDDRNVNAVADALISDRNIIVSKVTQGLKKKPRYYTIDVIPNRYVDGLTTCIKRELDCMLRDSGLGHCFAVTVVAAFQFTGSVRSYKNREGNVNISNKVLNTNPTITAIFEKDTTHNDIER